MKHLFALLGCVALVLVANVRAADPVPAGKELALADLGGYEDFKADPYLAAAASLQAMGKEKAVDLLTKLAEQSKRKDRVKVIVLCRMLFVAKPKGEFRRPALGGTFSVGQTQSKLWPLEPIELVDGIPFFMIQRHLLGGPPEHDSEYLDYCVKNCDWSTEVFKPKTAEEKRKAMAKLVKSPIWEEPITTEGKKVLAAQIE